MGVIELLSAQVIAPKNRRVRQSNYILLCNPRVRTTTTILTPGYHYTHLSFAHIGAERVFLLDQQW